jgi:DNA primase
MKGVGGMGVHYANGSLVDGKIQVRHPEALVYRFTRNGHLKLSALEYLVTVDAWRANHPTGRPELFGHRFNRTPDGNRFGLPAFFSLHAWLWYDNPAGTYKMFNPRVNCPDGI